MSRVFEGKLITPIEQFDCPVEYDEKDANGLRYFLDSSGYSYDIYTTPKTYAAAAMSKRRIPLPVNFKKINTVVPVENSTIEQSKAQVPLEFLDYEYTTKAVVKRLKKNKMAKKDISKVKRSTIGKKQKTFRRLDNKKPEKILESDEEVEEVEEIDDNYIFNPYEDGYEDDFSFFFKTNNEDEYHFWKRTCPILPWFY